MFQCADVGALLVPQVVRFKACAVPMLAFILDLADWEVRPVFWKSPLGQYESLKDGGAFLPGHIGLRVFVDEGHPWVPMAKFAAKEAFGKLSQTTLQAVATELGCDRDLGSGLFSMCFNLVQFVTGDGDDDVLDVLQKRCFPEEGHRVDQLVIHCDDLLDAVAPKDRDTMQKEIKKCKATQEDIETFKSNWTAKRHVVAKARAKGKGRSRASSSKAAPPPPPRRYSSVPDTVPLQASLKPYCPDGAFIWRANTTHRWYGRYRANPTISRSWETHPHAHKEVVRELWRQYLFDKALPLSDCPVPRLFA